jgi:hypothetical protein
MELTSQSTSYLALFCSSCKCTRGIIERLSVCLVDDSKGVLSRADTFIVCCSAPKKEFMFDLRSIEVEHLEVLDVQ